MNAPEVRYKLIESIRDPADLRKLSRSDLHQLADEMRRFLIESVSKTGGHLSSNLGTVELTIALHYVLNTPYDRLVWDVGHQTYTHKVLTGRREAMAKLRMWQGLSRISATRPRANTTRSAPPTPAPRSVPRSAWRSPLGAGEKAALRCGDRRRRHDRRHGL